MATHIRLDVLRVGGLWSDHQTTRSSTSAMITRLNHAVLYVRDALVHQRFYAEVLGFSTVAAEIGSGTRNDRTVHLSYEGIVRDGHFGTRDKLGI